jgi:hypothetical protein
MEDEPFTGQEQPAKFKGFDHCTLAILARHPTRALEGRPASPAAFPETMSQYVALPGVQMQAG